MLRGRRFGRLTVRSAAPSQGRVRCVCDCGRRFRPRLTRLRLGELPACGCAPAAPPPPPAMEECDCGRPRPPGAEACERCTWVDGGSAEMDVVSALRVLGEIATKEAILLEMGAGAPGTKQWKAAERRFYRLLAVLRRTGRVTTFTPYAGESMEPSELRYVAAACDPAATKNRLRNNTARGGYYVHVKRPKSAAHGNGEIALHVLVNTRRAG